MVRKLAERKRLSSRVTIIKLSSPQDFISDPVNPNVDGLLENIQQSCKAVIDDHGT